MINGDLPAAAFCRLHQPETVAYKDTHHGRNRQPVLPDYIQAGVRILFVGINPGLRSALLGHHFAGYSNRFWKVLYGAGLVPEPITYLDDWRLPSWGMGLTNIVTRPSAGIQELTNQDYRAGRELLMAKLERYRPPAVAILGLTLHCILFGQRRAKPRLGLQPERLHGSAAFLLPNPSGRNAHYSLESMVKAFEPLGRFLPRI